MHGLKTNKCNATPSRAEEPEARILMTFEGEILMSMSGTVSEIGNKCTTGSYSWSIPCNSSPNFCWMDEGKCRTDNSGTCQAKPQACTFLLSPSAHVMGTPIRIAAAPTQREQVYGTWENVRREIYAVFLVHVP